MEHTLNKSLFIILSKLMCFFWKKNRHFILVHLVFVHETNVLDLQFRISLESAL